ncbi:hypothetical protein LCGC14_0470480 [marine sediment metagenome]|uniref:Nucleoside 2-deoxyribosyltransferase n=1 Tax=marine sediment metagenome TaxID=412755 RepID=A0A0F9SHG9_9ZZZZ
MRVYFTARFSRRHECHALGKILETHGHTIVSRWTLPDTDHILPVGMSEQADNETRLRFANEDLSDVEDCQWCISLMENPRNNSRGGRLIEHAHAYAMMKFKINNVQRITIIGPRETVFHHLIDIEHFDTIDGFVHSLCPACGMYFECPTCGHTLF